MKLNLLKLAGLLLVGRLVLAGGAAAAEPAWPAVLAQMPLESAPATLTRTNTVNLMLNALRSNNVVKGLVFMPGATDELYFFQRVNVPLTAAGPVATLLDCVACLTNHTYIQATFRPPLLLLHTTEDTTEGFATVKSERARRRLEGRVVPGHYVFNDRDWDTVQPWLSARVRTTFKPGVMVEDSWHFYRHSFAAWNLTEWELLEATALSDKTRFTLTSWTAAFEGDRRHGPVPSVETIRVIY